MYITYRIIGHRTAWFRQLSVPSQHFVALTFSKCSSRMLAAPNVDINPLKAKMTLCYAKRFISYITENTVSFH